MEGKHGTHTIGRTYSDFRDLFWRWLLVACRDQCVNKRKWLIGVWRRIWVFLFQYDVDEILITEQHKSWHEWLSWVELYFSIFFFFFCISTGNTLFEVMYVRKLPLFNLICLIRDQGGGIGLRFARKEWNLKEN